MKRFRTLSAAALVAAAALVVTVTTPAAAASYSSGSVTCTGTRVGYLVVTTTGATRVLERNAAGGVIYTLNYRGNNSGRYIAGRAQSFSYEVIITDGYSTITSVVHSCE